jgi:membrane fusion protein, multidrug efflux system
MDERTPGADRPKLDPGHRETAPAPPDESTFRRSRLRPVLGAIVALLVLFGLYWLIVVPHGPAQRGTRATQSAPQPVAAATVGTGDVRIVVSALGTVTPLATVTVRTQINGQLTEVGFTEGQIVKNGDFLAQIDPRPYQVALQQAQGRLVHDQALLDTAKVDLTRYQNLIKTNAIPRQQLDTQVFLVKQYEGQILVDQAMIDTQKLNITYCHIVSPVNGRVGLRLVDPGNYVQTTDTTGIAVVTQLEPISVIFSVPEDDLNQIRAQLRAGATLEASAYDRTNVNFLAVGTLATIDNQIDTTTGTVKLRADFQNKDDDLFPNQFVNVRLLVKTLQNVVTVPTAAIQRGAPGTYVYVINANDTVSVRPIKVGPSEDDKDVVESGLKPGERVVIEGVDRLRDGAHVIIPGSGAQKGAKQPERGTPSKQGGTSSQQDGGK